MIYIYGETGGNALRSCTYRQSFPNRRALSHTCIMDVVVRLSERGRLSPTWEGRGCERLLEFYVLKKSCRTLKMQQGRCGNRAVGNLIAQVEAEKLQNHGIGSDNRGVAALIPNTNDIALDNSQFLCQDINCA
ncbi:hypothetical protein Trydic_g16933 [Trypoxylus dichotomus]